MPRRQRGRQSRICVVAPLAAFFPHTAAIQAVQQHLAPLNGDLLLEQHPPHSLTPERIQEVVRTQLAKADGIVWVSAFMEELTCSLSAIREFADRIVFVNLRSSDHAFSSVCADYEGAACALTEHLIGQGCKRIGYVGGPKGRLAADMRLAGFKKALTAHGLRLVPQDAREHVDAMSVEAGQKSIQAMLSIGQHPEAVFAVTDQTARGVIAGLNEAGLRVPLDVAVVGFDNDPSVTAIPPYLTTAQLPFHELGDKAMQLLRHQLEGTLAPGAAYHVECPIMVRESSQWAKTTCDDEEKQTAQFSTVNKRLLQST